MLKRDGKLQAYNSPEYIKDIGTPQRYSRICSEFASGVVQRSSLGTPQRAVFLDRDGALIAEKDCMRAAEELELLPGAGEALHRLNHHGWRAIVVTNQPVIAKGWATEAEVQRMHNKLETLLGREHAFLDRIYFCPHHPQSGFAGERKELKVRCDCRKPATGMIQRAVAEPERGCDGELAHRRFHHGHPDREKRRVEIRAGADWVTVARTALSVQPRPYLR